MLQLQVLVLALVAIGAAGVVLTRDPLKQSMVASFYGIILGLMFFIFQAPDVALSQIVIGAVALPMMILLALAKIKEQNAEREKQEAEEKAK